MTTVLEPDLVAEETALTDVVSVAIGEPTLETRRVSVPLVGLAALFSCSAAAWLTGGLLHSPFVPRLIALLGVAVGVGLAASSYRLSRPGLAQWSVLPIATVIGAALVAPTATGGTANLPSLVADAVNGGGLLHPPIPFNPGWRFILVVLMAVTGGAATMLSVELQKPKVAVLTPLPLIFGAALIQPREQQITASTISVLLIGAALAATYGVDLARSGDRQVGGSFETRRVLRGAGLLAALMVCIVGLSHADFLFPNAKSQNSVPPRKPPVTPLAKDRELVQVQGNLPGPWRTGVLDIYQNGAWYLPPITPDQVGPLKNGAIPVSLNDPPVPKGIETYSVTFKVTDLGGNYLPTPAQSLRVEKSTGTLSYDTRSGVGQLESRVPAGFTYTAVAAALPTAAQLNSAPTTPASLLSSYSQIPAAPTEVQALLNKAPKPVFDRLQFLRARLYSNVVAAGPGTPLDISATRVASLVTQKNLNATPYEIVAAEAMLARWAGVPSRIGFGYYGGTKNPDGYSLHPRDGRAWLESYFTGYGWVALVGQPPRAQAGLDNQDKKANSLVQPSSQLLLTVYIPLQRHSSLLLFQILQYWIVTAIPFACGGALIYLLYPPLLKNLRHSRRRKWALQHGPRGALAVTYAEFRDLCCDLNLGDAGDTPVRFVERFKLDGEHDELAWLVTRALWGDLRRDLRAEDADAAGLLALSVGRRVRAAQPALNRMAGSLSRVSLRSPWTDEVPNVWPRLQLRRRRAVIAAWLRRLRPRTASASLRRALPGSASLLLVLAMFTGLTGCAQQAGFSGSKVPTAYLPSIAPSPPATLLGYTFVSEPTANREYLLAGKDALVTEGKVFSIHRGAEIVGSLQVALFRPSLDVRQPETRNLIEQALGGRYTNERFGSLLLRRRELPNQNFILWFPPHRNAMVIFVFLKTFQSAPTLLRGSLGYMLGIDPSQVGTQPPLPPALAHLLAQPESPQQTATPEPTSIRPLGDTP